jgi:hypothetical protein
MQRICVRSVDLSNSFVRKSSEEEVMADTFEIKTYKCHIMSSRNTGAAYVGFMGVNKYLGGAMFSDDPLTPAQKYSNGMIGLSYRMADLPVILDLLRKEKPVYLIYDGPVNSRIATSDNGEPVGEEEDALAHLATLTNA